MKSKCKTKLKWKKSEVIFLKKKKTEKKGKENFFIHNSLDPSLK